MNLLPFLLFAFVASITPGPTNILVLANSQHFGVKIRFLRSGRVYCRQRYCSGFRCWGRRSVTPVSADTSGNELGGRAVAFWMSWQLFSAPAANLSSRRHVRFTARAAALLQVVNPKTWMMALAVVSLFAPASDHAFRDVALMALWFLAISVACLLCWAWLGKAVNRIFRTTVAMVRFQRAMALCLFISAWTGMLA